MEENINYTQMDGCSIEKLCPILCDVFDKDITSETMIKDLVEDDTRNIDKLQRCIIVNFGVHPIVGDIISSGNVLKLSTVIQNYIDSPKYLMSPEEIRRLQLEEIANNNSLEVITGKLTEASGILNDSLDKIKAVSAPTEDIGHKTKVGWINDVLDFVDPKVSKKELVNVVSKIDGNSKNAFDNLGAAIAATNTWIDAICKALIWIIKIEDDLYDVSEESSSKLNDMSKLLSTDGKNIEGLTKFGEIEKNRRKRLQQKMREFTADIEGKFDFLNDLNKDLRKKFDESLGLVNDKFDNAEKLLNKKVDLCIQELSHSQNDSLAEIKKSSDALVKAQEEFVSQSKEQTAIALSEFQKEAEHKTAEIQEQTDGFIENQNAIFAKIKKQLAVYKVVSVVALAVSIVSLLYNILF